MFKVKKSENFEEWYLEVIRRGKLVEYSKVKGFLVWTDRAIYIHEKYMHLLEKLLTKIGYKKFYFPLLIPFSLMAKESDHIKGFEKQVFWVETEGEKLAIRPTSETIMYDFFKSVIISYRDLPFKVFQTTSVYRYETKSTKPLIRDREILWNEAHSAHSTMEDVKREMKKILKIYKKIFDFCKIPVIFVNVKQGIFAGAEEAWEAYTIFPSGKVLEMGSINNLGQKFSKVFEIRFLDEKNQENFVYQGCYGISERVLAAIVAIHGDDKGLILPPSLSPIQAVIIPIYYNESEKEEVFNYCEKVLKKLKAIKIRAFIDYSEKTPGWKFNEYELLGIPIRIEIGKKEISEEKITIVKRTNGEKISLQLNQIKTILSIFKEIENEIKERAENYFKSMISYGKIEKGKISIVNVCQNCFDKIEKDLEILGIPLENNKKENCIFCGNICDQVVIGESY